MTHRSDSSQRGMASALPDELPFDEIDQRIIASLGHESKTRPLVAPQLRALLESKGYRGFAFMFEVPRLLDATDDHDAEKLWETATRPSGGFTVSGARAVSIESLATLDPHAAYEMASYSLKHEDWDRDRVVEVMLRIDRDKATPEIANHLFEAYEPSICRAMALQLRFSADPAMVTSIIEEAFDHPNRRRRRSAAFASGFLRGIVSDERLAQLSLSDTDQVVCRFAADSLRFQQCEQEAEHLITMLSQASLTESWAVCGSIIHLADASILTAEHDPLGFLAAIHSKPFALRKVFSDEIDKLKKKVNRSNQRWEDVN